MPQTYLSVLLLSTDVVLEVDREIDSGIASLKSPMEQY